MCHKEFSRLAHEYATTFKSNHDVGPMAKYRRCIVLSADVPRARQTLRKLLWDEEGEFAPLGFVPVVRGGRKTYDIRGNVAVAALFNDIGTEERT